MDTPTQISSKQPEKLGQRTAAVKARYQRIAPLYDLMEIVPERLYASWRQRLWSYVEGPRVLEVGVGTGKNIPYYPPDMQITAMDLTPGMLQRAEKTATEADAQVDLYLGDVQVLEFSKDTFDSVVATFVFCSVPDPVLGLREMYRVTKPGGKALFLEHVRSEKPILGPLMDLFNPVARLLGPNINRHTVANIKAAGFEVQRCENLGLGDIFKLIVARK